MLNRKKEVISFTLQQRKKRKSFKKNKETLTFKTEKENPHNLALSALKVLLYIPWYLGSNWISKLYFSC